LGTEGDGVKIEEVVDEAHGDGELLDVCFAGVEAFEVVFEVVFGDGHVDVFLPLVHEGDKFVLSEMGLLIGLHLEMVCGKYETGGDAVFRVLQAFVEDLYNEDADALGGLKIVVEVADDGACVVHLGEDV